MLFDEGTENLYGPILSPSAIQDLNAGSRMEGTDARTKLCHFVYARLLSTFLFLSTRFNQEDACLLITRCSERMAYLTLNASENDPETG